MKILIIGAGLVGTNLAEELSQEGHEVSIIDKDPTRCKELTQRLDIRVIMGDACRPSVLKAAGVEPADLVIAVTNSDEVNIVTCMLARRFNTEIIVARIRNEEYVEVNELLKLEDLYISRIINPEKIVVSSIQDILQMPGTTHPASFMDGKVLLRGFIVPSHSALVGKKLIDLKEFASTEGFLIGGISRNGVFFIPHGQDEIKAGDHIFVLISQDTVPFFLPLINKRMWGVHRIIIYGANQMGINLAKAVEENIKEVIIIDESEQKTTAAAERLDKTIVLRGKGTDLDVLKEAGLRGTDYFIALSEDDEDNLTSSLLAKKHGAKHTIVLTNDPDYVAILDSIDTDVVINPRLITASAILEYIRRGRIRRVVKIAEAETEIIEQVAQPNSRIVNKPLKEIKFPRNALIGVVLKGDLPVIPRGDTIIYPGEKVIVIAEPKAIKSIEHLFATLE